MLVVGGTAYIHGNAFALQNFFRFTAAQASQYAGKWIAIPATSGAYGDVAADVTFASFLSDLRAGAWGSCVRRSPAGESRREFAARARRRR